MSYITNTYWNSHYRAWILNMSLKYTLYNAFCFLVFLFSFKCTLGIKPKVPYIRSKYSPLLSVTSVEAEEMAQQLRTLVTSPQDSRSVSNTRIGQLTNTGSFISRASVTLFHPLQRPHSHYTPTHRHTDK